MKREVSDGDRRLDHGLRPEPWAFGALHHQPRRLPVLDRLWQCILDDIDLMLVMTYGMGLVASPFCCCVRPVFASETKLDAYISLKNEVDFHRK